MIVRAKSKYVRVSPTKIRMYADAIRMKPLGSAYDWLRTVAVKKIIPLKKTLFSAYSNAKVADSNVSSMNDLVIREIRIDQGPTVVYFKPGAMGRASVQRKRLSHIEVVLESL
jgi:large subunit ribosomal protein L22